MKQMPGQIHHKKELINLSHLIHTFFESEDLVYGSGSITQRDFQELKSQLKSDIKRIRDLLISEPTKCDENECEK